MGEKDDILEAEKFNDVMMDLVRFALVSRSHSTVPAGFDAVAEINDCIQRTKSGLVLGELSNSILPSSSYFLLISIIFFEGFHYKGIPISVDIVNMIPLGRSKMKESVRIFPGFDKKKLDFLVRKKLFSNRDGVIAKNGNWRLSFSNSEARLLRKLDMEEDDFVYRTIKYFANISGLPICSYAIKVRVVTLL